MSNPTFAEKVLKLTEKIPKGKVTTYRIIANKLGTRAYRAVGSALKHNQYPVVVPCHRVVKSDGSVGGYDGLRESSEKVKLLMNEGIAISDGKILDFENVLFCFESSELEY